MSVCKKHNIEREIISAGRGKSYEQCPKCLEEDREIFRSMPFKEIERGKVAECTYTSAEVQLERATWQRAIVDYIDTVTGPTGGWLVSPKKFGDHILAITTDQSALDKHDAELRNRIERLDVQLVGCMTAAKGWAKNPPQKGDYGWSPAFQDTLDLRQKYETLQTQTAALLEMAEHSLERYTDGYYRCQCGTLFASNRAEALTEWRLHILALIPADTAAALADREAVIHHSYQCGEAYERLVSAQVDQIVAERMQEAVQPFAEALEALVGKVAESSRRSQVMWLPDIGEVWKARDLLAAHHAAVGAQEKK